MQLAIEVSVLPFSSRNLDLLQTLAPIFLSTCPSNNTFIRHLLQISIPLSFSILWKRIKIFPWGLLYCSWSSYSLYLKAHCWSSSSDCQVKRAKQMVYTRMVTTLEIILQTLHLLLLLWPVTCQPSKTVYMQTYICRKLVLLYLITSTNNRTLLFSRSPWGLVMDAPPTLRCLECSYYLDRSPAVRVLNRIWLEMQLNVHNMLEELHE